MKYFTNLSQTSFNSSIGSFTICNFFDYPDITKVDEPLSSYSIDNKTTLVEAAYSVYQDQDTYWSFLLANKKINPFDLVKMNSTLFANENAEKISLSLFGNSGDTLGGKVFPEGSLILPKIANTGPSYSYGSTGNYDLDGQFTMIEKSLYYEGNMIIGLQYGGANNFIDVNNSYDSVIVLQKNSDGTYSWAGAYYAGNKQYATEKIVSISQPLDGKTIDRDARVSNITIDQIVSESPAVEAPPEDGGMTPIPGPPGPLVSGTTYYIQITAQEKINNEFKEIFVYTPTQLGQVNASFVTSPYA